MTINNKSKENINLKFNCRENPFISSCIKFSNNIFLEKKFKVLKFKFEQLKSFDQDSLLFCGYKQLALKAWRHWFFYLKQNNWIIYCYAIKYEIIDPNIEERTREGERARYNNLWINSCKNFLNSKFLDRKRRTIHRLTKQLEHLDRENLLFEGLLDLVFKNWWHWINSFRQRFNTLFEFFIDIKNLDPFHINKSFREFFYSNTSRKILNLISKFKSIIRIVIFISKDNVEEFYNVNTVKEAGKSESELEAAIAFFSPNYHRSTQKKS